MRVWFWQRQHILKHLSETSQSLRRRKLNLKMPSTVLQLAHGVMRRSRERPGLDPWVKQTKAHLPVLALETRPVVPVFVRSLDGHPTCHMFANGILPV